jgi:hypothetical protein
MRTEVEGAGFRRDDDYRRSLVGSRDIDGSGTKCSGCRLSWTRTVLDRFITRTKKLAHVAAERCSGDRVIVTKTAAEEAEYNVGRSYLSLQAYLFVQKKAGKNVRVI